MSQFAKISTLKPLRSAKGWSGAPLEIRVNMAAAEVSRVVAE